jgi:hypothetical protein
MPFQDSDDYDKLSPIERVVRDKADRQREADGGAGRHVFHPSCLVYCNSCNAIGDSCNVRLVGPR